MASPARGAKCLVCVPALLLLSLGHAQYMRQVGTVSCWLIFVGLVAGQAAFLASEWWLALWSRASAEDQQDAT